MTEEQFTQIVAEMSMNDDERWFANKFVERVIEDEYCVDFDTADEVYEAVWNYINAELYAEQPQDNN